MRNIGRGLLLAGVVSLSVVALAGTSSARGRHVTLSFPGSGGPTFEPRNVYTSEASLCSEYAHGLNDWHHWGARRAFSRGRLHYSTGIPDCADGSHTTRGKVFASHIQRCRTGLHYGKLRFAYFGHHKYDARFKLTCSGRVSGLIGPPPGVR